MGRFPALHEMGHRFKRPTRTDSESCRLFANGELGFNCCSLRNRLTPRMLNPTTCPCSSTRSMSASWAVSRIEPAASLNRTSKKSLWDRTRLLLYRP